MSIETRSKSIKRSRPEGFDLNNSIVAVERKRVRKGRTNLDMAGEGGEPNGQITDLSGSINSANDDAGTASAINTPTFPGDVLRRQRVLENNVHTVQGQMGDMRKAIEELSKTINQLKELTINQTRDRSVSDSGLSGSNCNGQAGSSSSTTVNNNGLGPGTSVLVNRNWDNSKVRIDKLGLKFDASSQGLGVEEFVYRLEYFQEQYGIPWSEIIRDFPLIVSGPAESWYWLSQKTNKYRDWPQLKHCLLNQYQSSRSNFEILTELAQRKQQMHETIDMFFQNMGQIRAKLVQPISEYDMIKIMKKNIKESIGRIIYPIQVSSVEQLRIECNEAEKNFPRRDMRNIPPPSRPIRQINEVFVGCPSESDYENPDYEEISAIQYNRQARAPLKCWNCQKTGHSFRDCDSTTRALFCYKCGRPGTVTPRCPTCLQGNLNKGVENVGGPRPPPSSPTFEE